MNVLTETVGPFAENAYLVVEPESREALLVDPGDEAGRILGRIQEEGLRVDKILLTHAHLDHVGAVVAIQRETQATVWMHASDEFLLDGLGAQAALFGLPEPEKPKLDGFLKGGDVVTFSPKQLRVDVIETPGHSPGSVTFAVGGVLLCGDALFAGSIGRTDLPGGDAETLLESIRSKLLEFPDATTVYPGHGPSTTIGRERSVNPFLRAVPE